ncbi:SPFH domain-containing protein [Berryella wangjianweii]|uniref:SPFH domain-containing protein n=1 Tax=Berryella wangjianweii TaxID=2734634 RepID=A0A6M8J3V1_9ACTN|nr:SPFH domain-containing protein [Berryella wangjianweii]QKF07283.1 SPFH domain-containing protein [Berryella wangjianweii]
MGLIKAAIGAGGGVLADQWRDFYFCDMGPDTLIARGYRQHSTKGRTSNTKGEDNVISNGSKIAVNEGQCLLVIQSGKVVDFCAEAGEYVFDQSTEASLFYGNLGENLISTLKQVGERFAFGGDQAKDQRVYFVNTKEIIGNKFGTPSPVPFRVVDKNVGLDIDLAVRANGMFSYRIVDPVRFYANIAGSVTDRYMASDVLGQLRSEMLAALQGGFAAVSALGVRYSALPGHVDELAEALRAELAGKWTEGRGITLETVSLNAVNVSDDDAAIIKQMQTVGALRDPGMAAGSLVAAQGEAMRSAAANESAGAFGAFMGLGMAQNAGGATVGQLFEQSAQAKAQAAATQGAPAAADATTVPSAAWQCPQCGTAGTGRFCGECGTPRPVSATWFCPECGNRNEGKFCPQCGTKRP